MDYKSSIRKHGIIIAICAICSLLIVAGTSYALFYQNHTNSNNQVLRTGKLSVSYGSESNRITLETLNPVSNEVGLSDPQYSSTVKIENNGSLPAAYDLKFGKDLDALAAANLDATNFVNLQYVMIAVFKGEDKIVTEKRLSELTPGEDGLYLLDSGTLADKDAVTGSSVEYTVRLWLASDTDLETEHGKYVYFKLDVSSEVDKPATVEGQAANS